VINAIRTHLAEFGIVAPVGRKGVAQLLDVVADARDQRVPKVARACVAALGAQLRMLKAQILEFDRRILAWHRSNETSRRLDAIPGTRGRLSFGALGRLTLFSGTFRKRPTPLAPEAQRHSHGAGAHLGHRELLSAIPHGFEL
jgi:transposase